MPSGCGFLSPQETRGLTAHGSPKTAHSWPCEVYNSRNTGGRRCRQRHPSIAASESSFLSLFCSGAGCKSLLGDAGGLQRRGKVLSQTLEDKTGTQKRQSPVFFGRKSFSSQPLMGLSCVRDFSERPHAAPLPHKRDEGVRNQFSGGNRCHPDGPAVRNSSLLHPESAHGQQCTSRQLGQFARDG